MNYTNNSFVTNFDVNGTSNDATEEIIVVDFSKWYRYGFEFVLFGYFIPLWILINIIIYFIMISVFLRNGMTSKTHMCLIMIAICDMLGSIPPALTWFREFGINKEYSYLPFSRCRVYHITTEVIPRMFAFASRLLTVVLAVQRYIIIAYPFKASILCSKNKIHCWLLFCLLFPILALSVYFFHYDFFPFTVPTVSGNNSTMEACAVRGKGWFNLSFYQYIIMIDFLYTITCHFVPATLLILFEILLINAMSKNTKRKNLVNGSAQMKRKNNREKRLTLTTLVITLIDLIYEMAQTTRDVLNCANWLGYVSLIQGDLRSANLILQILYWIAMPSNFIIICSCSKDFRQALKNMFLPFLPGTKQQPTSVTDATSKSTKSVVSVKEDSTSTNISFKELEKNLNL